MTEGHELADQVTGATLLVDAALVEVRAQVHEAERGIVEEVPDDGEDRAGDGDDGGGCSRVPWRWTRPSLGVSTPATKTAGQGAKKRLWP